MWRAGPNKKENHSSRDTMLNRKLLQPLVWAIFFKANWRSCRFGRFLVWSFLTCRYMLNGAVNEAHLEAEDKGEDVKVGGEGPPLSLWRF